MICDRCSSKVRGLKGSFLNSEMICLLCVSEEKKHPRYEEAKRRELEEVQKGNYNYPGLLYGEGI